MVPPWHLLWKNNVHMQRVRVVLQILASSAVLLIWNSWPCSCSCSCSWHCVEKKQTAAKRRQGCAGSRFVCLFVCTCNALLWHRHCTFHRHSHFPFNVSLQQIRFVYLFLFSILTRKTKQKKYVPWATLCDSCEPLLESIKNEQLHASRCLAVFDQPKETFCHVWLPSLFSALPLKAVPADALSFPPRTFDACFILIHKVLVALCWKKNKITTWLAGWKGGCAREGLLGHGWMSDLPLNSDLQHSWHLEIMSNNIVPGWLGSAMPVRWTLRVLALHREAATGWDMRGLEMFFFIFF